MCAKGLSGFSSRDLSVEVFSGQFAEIFVDTAQIDEGIRVISLSSVI